MSDPIGQSLVTTSAPRANGRCMDRIDIAGQRFGRLTILAFVGTGRDYGKKDTNARWTARCDCGVEVVVSGKSLRTGKTASCGCLRREVTRANSTRHGNAPVSGLTPEYRAWKYMLTRCTNANRPDWMDYGGRGITICQAWLESFDAFLRDMGPKPSPRHSLDRINVDGNYELGNCRWASPFEQAQNTRVARKMTHRGETKTLSEWARHLGMTPASLHGRLARGWSTEEALATPKGATRPKGTG